MSHLINLTPHAINLIAPGAGEIIIPPSGDVARVYADKTIENIEAVIENCHYTIPVGKVEYGKIIGLPKNDTEAIYIVSAMVLSRAEQENLPHNLVAPDTGNAIRNPDGTIRGVPGFIKY
ncbi:hypothetical protein D6827_01715 [Candidatus Parcubacteria bacterium]|nr:MAG: hypothetical protein D6827_01715 [Candidatus Parcubacteria bacterium]